MVGPPPVASSTARAPTKRSIPVRMSAISTPAIEAPSVAGISASARGSSNRRIAGRAHTCSISRLMISMPVRSPLWTVRSKVWPANALPWRLPSGLRSKKQPISFSSSRTRSMARVTKVQASSWWGSHLPPSMVSMKWRSIESPLWSGAVYPPCTMRVQPHLPSSPLVAMVISRLGSARCACNAANSPAPPEPRIRMSAVRRSIRALMAASPFYFGPHPEEAHRSRARPTSTSHDVEIGNSRFRCAVSKDGPTCCGPRPPFETPASPAPQDEVRKVAGAVPWALRSRRHHEQIRERRQHRRHAGDDGIMLLPAAPRQVLHHQQAQAAEEVHREQANKAPLGEFDERLLAPVQEAVEPRLAVDGEAEREEMQRQEDRERDAREAGGQGRDPQGVLGVGEPPGDAGDRRAHSATAMTARRPSAHRTIANASAAMPAARSGNGDHSASTLRMPMPAWIDAAMTNSA